MVLPAHVRQEKSFNRRFGLSLMLGMLVVAGLIFGIVEVVGQEVPPTDSSLAPMAVGLPRTSAPASTAEMSSESSPITGGRPEKATVTSAPVDVQIDVVPFLGPELSNPESGVVIARLIEDYLAGKLRLGRGYVICNGRVYWTDTVMGAGFDTIKQLIIARSKGGGDDVSLDQIIVKATSSGGVLSGTYSVPSGYGYGPNAVGIMENGAMITSGPGDQKVQTVMFVTQMPLFTGGETVAGQNDVRNWIQSNGMTITYEVMIRGNQPSKRYATVTTGPWLEIVRLNKPDSLEVVLQTGDSLLYNLFASPTVTGPWTNKVAKGNSGLRWPLHPIGPAMFFKGERAP